MATNGPVDTSDNRGALPNGKKPPFMRAAKKPDDKLKIAKSEAAKRRLQLMNMKGKGK